MDYGTRTLKDSFAEIPIDESFKLVAGPGAGKTTFLVNHIKHVIEKSNKLKNGRKILCITYTNVAVDNIKKKLGENINEVEISTIHYFLYHHVLKPYIWVLRNDISPNLLDFSEVILSFPSFSMLPRNSTLNLFQRGFSRHDIYSQLKKFYWDFDESDNIKPICNGKVEFDEEYLWEYKQNQWNSQKITFPDILKFSLEILKKEPKIVEILRIKFPYIFIDEFQDVCSIQKRIIEELCKNNVVCGLIGDSAQSIYSFRGAHYGNLNSVNLNLNEYNLLINRRCNNKIVNVLNNLRNDGLIQVPLDNTPDNVPTILIGDELNAFEYVEDAVGDKFNVLAYRHRTLNDLEFRISSDNGNNDYEDLKNFWNLEDPYRKLIIEYTVRAIESFRDGDIKESLRHMTFAYHYFETDDKWLIKKLFSLSENYSKFKDSLIIDFYLEYIHVEGVDKLKKFKSGKPKDVYSQIRYIDLAKDIKSTHNSIFRTIHDCKGEEFDNVLVLVGDSTPTFLYNFNIETIRHRIFYVALSRAKNNLFVSILNLDNSKYSSLKEKGFDIIDLD